MKLSVIIPAYNEEKLLPGCLEKVFAALDANNSGDYTSKVIVVDNNSTDRTAELARAGRSGGRLRALEPDLSGSQRGCAGRPGRLVPLRRCRFSSARGNSCGATPSRPEGKHRGWRLPDCPGQSPRNRPLLHENLQPADANDGVGGGFVCLLPGRRFREIGGFSTELYAAEEIRFSQDLKRWGKARGLGFAMLHRQHHVSSGRKFYLYSAKELRQHLVRGLLLAHWTIRDQKKLAIFYDGREVKARRMKTRPVFGSHLPTISLVPCMWEELRR